MPGKDQNIVLDDIPFSLDFDRLAMRVHLDCDDPDDLREFGEMIDLARKISRPKALYRECDAKIVEPGVAEIGGELFYSKVLTERLGEVKKVFVNCATCGQESDALLSDDPLKRFWAEEIRVDLLGQARNFMIERIKAVYQLDNLNGMAPGSGETEQVWSIMELKTLFRLAEGDFTRKIGVELLDTCLMLPTKTIAGVLFESKHDFASCQLCRRSSCPNRKAPFDEKLWQQMEMNH